MKAVLPVLAALSLVSPPQAPANTEIYLTTINPAARPMIAATLTNITSNPGYDSQPGFLPDGSGVLFSSVRGGTQYDIFKYDIASKAITNLTNSPDNENSPIVTPDGKTFSAVRSEIPVGAENQRLWRFNLDGSNPTVLIPEIRRIGYHVWIDATHLALYVLGANGEPNSLQLADTATGKAETIDTRIGRALLLRPRTGTVTFISQPQGGKPVVKELDPKTKQATTMVEAVEGSMNRDAVWHTSGVLLMSAGTKIYAWTPPAAGAAAAQWVEAGDFSAAGVTNITRMAVAPRGSNGSWRFAFVAEPVAK